jgi:peptidyl-prolyl cis-trans isomerase D
MLNWLRKYSKSWFIALVIGAIVVVFILWGVGSFQSSRFQEAAQVNGASISMTAFMRAYQEMIKRYQEEFKGELTEEMIKTMHLKEQTLNRLIDEALIFQAADRLGIRVSDAELQEAIRSYPYFQEDGKFSQRRYFQALSRVRIAPADFEAQERKRLLIQKVMQDVSSLAKVSEAELQELYRMGRETVEVRYLELAPDKYLARQRPGEGDLERYFQEHQAAFTIPTRVRVNYVLLSTKDFLAESKVSPEEAADFVAQQKDEYIRPKEIRARHLFLAFPPKAAAKDRKQVEEQAQKLLARVNAGEDFAKLAEALSQDKESKGKGGDLGLVKRGRQPPEWEKTAFALPPGQAGLAATPLGWYVIRVEEVTATEPAPDAEARAVQRLKEEKARRLAREAAQQARGELSAAPLPEVARKFKAEAKETPLFGLKEPVPGLGIRPNFHQAALKLKPKEVSPVVELAEGYAVLQGMERQPERVPPLEEIKPQVLAAVKKDMALKQAEQEAQQLLERLKKGEPISQAAAQAGLGVKDSGFFSRYPGFLNQPAAEILTSAAFSLSQEHPYPEKPLLWQDKYYVLAFKARQTPDPAQFQKDREKLEQSVMDYKRRIFLESWLAGERKRAKIKIYDIPL